jgi:hypothetical protein
MSLEVKSDVKGTKKAVTKKELNGKNSVSMPVEIEERLPLVGRRTNNSLQYYYEEAKVMDIGQTKTPSSTREANKKKNELNKKPAEETSKPEAGTPEVTLINKSTPETPSITNLEISVSQASGSLKIIDVPSLTTVEIVKIPSEEIAEIPSEEVVEASSLETVEIIEASSVPTVEIIEAASLETVDFLVSEDNNSII